MTATLNQNDLKSSKLVLSLDNRQSKGFNYVFYDKEKAILDIF